MAELRDTLVNTLIGAGSALRGDLDVNGMLRIDGDFSGSIRALGKVVVGSGARVDSSIRAHSVIVGGRVRGDLYISDSARLLAGAVVVGNIFAPYIEVEEGALVHGAVSVTGRPASAEAELQRFVASHGDVLRFLGRFREDPGQAALPAASGPLPGAGREGEPQPEPLPEPSGR
jgi:cytoskeletal protein CcmA (bactofilin family)